MGTLNIGDHVINPEFKWIKAVGFASYYRHGNSQEKESGGSIKAGTLCTVVGHDSDSGIYLVVVNEGNPMPFGAEAPIGIIFQVPSNDLESWNVRFAALKDHDAQKNSKVEKMLSLARERKLI